jgi:hypothetical protein
MSLAQLRGAMANATANPSHCEGIAGRFDTARPSNGNSKFSKSKIRSHDGRIVTPYFIGWGYENGSIHPIIGRACFLRVLL